MSESEELLQVKAELEELRSDTVDFIAAILPVVEMVGKNPTRAISKLPGKILTDPGFFKQIGEGSSKFLDKYHLLVEEAKKQHDNR